MLKTARKMLIATKLNRLSATNSEPSPGGGAAAIRRARATAPATASSRFMPGPASATRIMWTRGLRIRRATTGTGFAQPNTGAPLTARNSGRTTVPIGSTWRIGLRLSRPRRRAVGSPKALATQPCATSWKTMATTSGINQVATRNTILSGPTRIPFPFVGEDREEHGIADMASPSDPLGADHPLAHRAQFGHCRLAAPVARVDAELDPPKAAIDRTADHQVLHPAVEAGAAEPRHVIGVADLEHAALRIDAEIGAHAHQLAAEQDREGAAVRAGPELVEARVEMIRIIGDGVDRPDIGIERAGVLQRLAVGLGERLQAQVALGHRLPELHSMSLPKSRATFGWRSRASTWLPSSKLSSARNFSLAAYLVFTRLATARWR